ncbi:MAG: DegT/DnrJ/EryC1/StrS family aminotransferase [Candidatus Altiarchaeota archaeon]|nr:DegT/DnrJ/EryC1/StrS family aminotransferase [Candidatus Altiarchaeota archaeon]
MDYKVRFINYPKQYHLLKGEVDGAILRCLESGDLILREDLQKFERDFANFCNRKYCVTTDSCTGAMFLSLCAAGVGRGDEVITVSHTYIATIDVIVHCGATPVLVDVGNDFNMDMSLLEKAITPKTKAILPVHLNGRMCDMKYLMEVAEKHGLTVVEDCAQAPGAEYTGRMAGSFGLTGCFSFYPSKVLGSFGDGGALVTDDEDLADRLYLLRDHGERPKYRGDSAGKIPFYGFNSLLDNLQAAVLTVKLKHLPEYIKKRRELASRYDKGLKDLPLFLPPVPSHSQYFDVFQNYVVRAAERDRLRGYLTKNGVETLCQWPIPNHLQEGLGLKHFKLPVTERLSKEVVSLPMCVNWRMMK